MKIDHSKNFIYDEETYPDIFTCAIGHAATDQTWFFEISDERNDFDALCIFIHKLKEIDAAMVGYNNIGFDYPILHMILTHQVKDAYTIYLKCQAIIDGEPFDHLVWDSDHIVRQIDLYKIHHFDNASRRCSLKQLEFNMRSHNIEDLPFEPGKPVGVENYPILRHYNKHDVSETKKFYFHTVKALEMRADLSAKYNKDFTNHNDTKIGKDYFIMKLGHERCYYRDHNNRRQPRQSIRVSIPLGDVIFNYIQFEQPEFNRVLDYFKAQEITETKGVFKDLTANMNGFAYDFGVGGIHGSVKAQTIVSDDGYMIIDIDVKSYYPNIAIANKLFPEHLGADFCAVYLDVYNQRLATSKKSPENAMLKLALNGVYGDSNNKYSPFYDPAYTMAITINGQMLLCMLAEQLIKSSDLTMIQINTDGLTIKIPRYLDSWVSDVCKWWESLTSLTLETVEYNRMFIRDVNNFIGEFTDGSLKRKGAYAHNRDDQGELPWHKDHGALIVAKAAQAALVDGIDPAAFIRSHNNYMDFMKRAKVPRSSKLVGVIDGYDTPLSNITRYYVTTSKTGVALVKIMPPLKKKPDHWRRIGIDVGFVVAPCNNLDDVRLPINFDYYIEQARKLIDPLC